MGRKAVTKKTALIYILLLSVLLTSCTRSIVVHGQFNFPPDVAPYLRKMELGLLLIDEDLNQYDHFSRLSRDGRFSFRIRREGRFYALMRLSEVLSPKRLFLSNDFRFFEIDTAGGRRQELKHLYLTSILPIYTPAHNGRLGPNTVISWRKDMFADSYQVFLSRRRGEPEEIDYISAFVKGTSVTLREILALPNYTDYEVDFPPPLPFVRLAGEITPGTYSLSVSGRRFIGEDNVEVFTSLYEWIEIELYLECSTATPSPPLPSGRDVSSKNLTMVEKESQVKI